MPPTIRVDDEVWKELQVRAEPFVDNPNSVLRRLLALSPGGSTSRSVAAVGEEGRIGDGLPVAKRRRPRGEGLPQGEFRQPILRALELMGGEGEVEDVLRKVYDLVKERLSPHDHDPVPSGSEATWRNLARWERREMIRDGVLDSLAPRGVWRLTDHGRKAAALRPD